MAEHQTRRAVSLSAEVAAALDAFSDANKISRSQVVDQAVKAMLAGRVELLPAVAPSDIGMRTWRRRRGEPAEGPPRARGPRVKSRRARRSSVKSPPPIVVDLAAGLRSDAEIDVSKSLREFLGDVASRQGVEVGVLLDGAVARMIDHLTSNPGALCRGCLEMPGDCNCK